MIEISDHAELAERCHGDLLCLWAAQGLVERRSDSRDRQVRSRAWRSADGSAVAVAGPDLSTRNRIAVHGRAAAAVSLVGGVLDTAGSTFRPLGDPDLIGAVVAGIPQLMPVAAFGWMDSRGPAPQWQTPGTTARPGCTARLGTAAGPPTWLSAADMPDVSALMSVSFPDSDAQPGGEGVERWAGIRDQDGRLMAVTALAWSAPDVGYLAGVAVHPDARGRGYGRAVCRFVLAEALARHGAAALMVEEWNEPAIRLYQGLGMSYRTLTAAAVTTP